MIDLTYKEAMAKRASLIDIGHTSIYLRDEEENFPWDKVVSIETGCSYRLNGPSSMSVIAEDEGLKFRLNVEFEGRDANGRGVSMFDRERLRGVIMRLPDHAQIKMADMLATKVLPEMAKRTDELRKAMNSQIDSEECVRGLIAFAERA